jgi:predicted HTH domain antitoxin
MKWTLPKLNRGGIEMGRELVLRWLIPDTVDKELENEIVNQTKEEVVLRLFKEGKISSGYGAELLKICLADFMDLLEQRGIPFTTYTEKHWEQDKKAAEEMRKQLTEKKGGRKE